MQVINFDRAALRAKGLTDTLIDRGRADLDIILAELERDPSSPVAVTEAADLVLHDALDRGLVGIDHDPNAWGTPAFLRSWERTRGAFARAGVELDVDPAAKRNDGRAGVTCFVTIKAAA